MASNSFVFLALFLHTFALAACMSTYSLIPKADEPCVVEGRNMTGVCKLADQCVTAFRDYTYNNIKATFCSTSIAERRVCCLDPESWKTSTPRMITDDQKQKDIDAVNELLESLAELRLLLKQDIDKLIAKGNERNGTDKVERTEERIIENGEEIVNDKGDENTNANFDEDVKEIDDEKVTDGGIVEGNTEENVKEKGEENLKEEDKTIEVEEITESKAKQL